MAGRKSYDEDERKASMKDHLKDTERSRSVKDTERSRSVKDTERSRSAEYQYLNLLRDIMKNGWDKPVFGTDARIRSVFGRMMRFDLSKGFPLLTTKKVFTRGIIIELLWFLKGDSNIKYLVDNNVHIWDEWAYKNYNSKFNPSASFDKAQDQSLRARIKNSKLKEMTQEEFVKKIQELPANDPFVKKYGDLGNVYGVQWRKWQASDGRTIDQLKWAINELKTTPFRKSIVVSAWNPEFIYEMALPGKSMALPPCHTLFQLNVQKKRLSLALFQRSCDMFLGIPFNVASYSVLTMMLAQVSGFEPGEFVHVLGDTHIYHNHFDQVKEQLKRKPRPFPKMKLNPNVKNIDDFTLEDFTLEGYDPYPPIKGAVTVVGGF